MRIIGYTTKIADGQVLIQESTGESCSSDRIEELLVFLASPLDEPHQKVVWELAQFTAPLFRLLSDKAIDRLAKEHKVWLGRFSLFYIAEKLLIITHGRLKAAFYELQQYFPDIADPGDSLAVANYGVGLLTDLRKIGLHIREGDRLTSPAAILEDKLLNELDLPKDEDVPIEAEACNAYAYGCTGKLWISAIKLGHWQRGQIRDYDLSGAFAWEASQLYDFREADFVYSKTPVIGAHWGFLRGRVTIDCPVSPIMSPTEEGFCNPIGTWDTILTLDEVRFISRYKIGHFKMADGFFIFQHKKTKPLEPVIQKLYELRKQTPALDLFLKRATLGCFYGKFIEMHNDGPGRHFCPIAAATISARARLKVGAFILDNNLVNDLIHVSVDGLLATKKVDLPQNNGLGKWRMSEPEGVIVASAGQVFKKTTNRQTRPKGIDYDTLVSMIQMRPRVPRYELIIPRRVTLGEAAGGHYGELGKIKDFHSSIDFTLQQHTDRYFPKLPRSGETLMCNHYESEPIRL